MIKKLSLFCLLLLLAGCSRIDYNAKPHLMAFPEEDVYILTALHAESQKDYTYASELFSTLYERSGKREYLAYSLQMLYDAKAYDALIKRSRELLQSEPESVTIRRFEIIGLMENKENEAAKKRALELLSLSKTERDYLLVSKIYINQKHYDTALKYLERAYAINYNEVILDKMVIVLYVNLGRKSEAVSHLESHSRLHGCSKLVCNRLISFYSDQNNVEGLISTYVRMYESDRSDHNAHALISIYNYQKDYVSLMAFLLESGADDAMLLNLYINNRSYDKASELAMELYQKEGDVTFLAQHAMFYYEAHADKNDPKMLNKVVELFKKVLRQSDDSLYLNYLGYLMIDHDLDIDAGIGYVNRALKAEPDSPYYLDSLGWGYYKLGQCKEALELIERSEKELGEEDDDVQSHKKAIQNCLKKGKKKE